MEKLSTRGLARMLLESFAKNDGVGKFGFVLSMYEFDDNDKDYKTETVFVAENPDVAMVLMQEIDMLYEEMESDIGPEEEDEGDWFNLN